MTKKFNNLAAFRAERAFVKLELAEREARLVKSWGSLREPGFRHGLAWNALDDLLQSWKPMRIMGALAHSNDGFLENILVSALKSRAHTFKGRMFAWAIGIVAPYIVRHYTNPETLQSIASRMQEIWRKFRAPVVLDEDEDEEED